MVWVILVAARCSRDGIRMEAPAVLAVTTDTFVVYTSNVSALLGMRALYFLLAGAAARFRYLRPGLAVILAAVAVKLLTADLYQVPVWASPAFIAAVLAAVAILSVRDRRRGARTTGPRDRSPAGARGHLHRGSAGPAVRAVQDQINFRNLKDGRTLTVDGLFGPKTETSVRAFQKGDGRRGGWLPGRRDRRGADLAGAGQRGTVRLTTGGLRAVRPGPGRGRAGPAPRPPRPRCR